MDQAQERAGSCATLRAALLQQAGDIMRGDGNEGGWPIVLAKIGC